MRIAVKGMNLHGYDNEAGKKIRDFFFMEELGLKVHSDLHEDKKEHNRVGLCMICCLYIVPFMSTTTTYISLAERAWKIPT